MKAVVQRVLASSVTVDGKVVGQIEKGFNVLVGVMQGDTLEDAQILAAKIAKLRVFEDEAGKMNLALEDVGGSVLAISQFTLCADIKKGNRPSFTPAAQPQIASELYDSFCVSLQENGVSKVEKGIFGADMKVEILNDGPITILMDTEIWRKKS